MKKISSWITQHQIAAFLILAFIISWGLAFSYSAVLSREQPLMLPVFFVAACGPGLAGVIISTVINTQPRQEVSKSLFWIAFLAAWFVTALVCLANLHFVESMRLSPELIGLFIAAVVPVAFVVASAYSRNPSVRSYLSSLVRLRGVWGMSVIALGLFPALLLISVPVSGLLGGQAFASDQFPQFSLSLVGLILVKFLSQLFFFNATGEETGWRGFALPRFQEITNPLMAALVIGLFWALHHVPFWKAEARPGMSVDFWFEMFIGIILISIMLVWIFNRAKGSILVTGIAHAALNTVQAYAPFGNLLFAILLVAALVMIFADQMWKKLPSDHPAVYRKPTPIIVEKGKNMFIEEVSNV